MINTLKHGALLVTAIFMVATPAHSQAPTDAQRNAIRSAMPRRLSGALRQRAAGRRSLAAMPAEEHVEPLVRAAQARCARSNPRRRPRRSRRLPRRPRPVPLPPLRPPLLPPLRLPQLRSPQPRRRQRLPRLPRARRRSSRPMRRSPRSAAPAAPTIRRSAPACRPAALRHCNAWKRTRRRCRRPARRPSTRPAAVPHPLRAAPWRPRPGAAAPAAAPAPVMVLRPMRPREELFVLRSACSGDVRTLCGGVAPGGGRIMQCLATRAGSISPACKEVLAQFAAN